MSNKDAEQEILAKIRKSLGAVYQDPERHNVVEARLNSHPANIVPDRAHKPNEEKVRILAEMLETHSATVTIVRDTSEIPEAIVLYLSENKIPKRVRHGKDKLLSGLPWNGTPQLERLNGAASEDDCASLSRASAGAAETGTLFLASGPDNPTTLNFLPETHIIVIRADDLFGSYEEAWNRLGDVYGSRTLPCTVNLISGPSRTTDIEQTIVMGAHGPKRLHILLASG